LDLLLPLLVAHSSSSDEFLVPREFAVDEAKDANDAIIFEE